MMKVNAFRSYFKLLIAGTLVASGSTAYSQDVHFSQFYTSPLFSNPAAAGSFNGDYRVISNYKSQWTSISDPYRTMFASFDMSIKPIKKKKTQEVNGFLSAGLTFMKDKAGQSDLGITSVNLPISYTTRMTDKLIFSGGVQVGWNQRSINVSALQWDNQYDGEKYNAALPSREAGIGQGFSYFDFASGILFNYQVNKEMRFNSGISATHLLRPARYFNGGPDRLYRKFVWHSGGQVHIKNTNFYILPYLYTVMQGRSYEINGGGYFKYLKGMDSRYTEANTSSSLSFGFFYRYMDAVIPSIWYEYKRMLALGVSYDITVSKLTAATWNGGAEVSLIFFGWTGNDRIQKIKEVNY